MSFAEGCDPPGNNNSVVTNITHETATMPIGRYHFPKENGPGTSLFLPEVMRSSMGVAYELYRPITEALRFGHM